MVKAILDTDIGTDVDDAMALIFLLKSPEISLEGITTVYGDVQLRARIAMKLIALAGKKDIPVAAGVEKPLLRERTVFRAGNEGKGLITEKDTHLRPIREHATDFIIRSTMENRGKTTLITIGPLTNVATAMIKEPAIVKEVKEVIFIGGNARLSDNVLDVPAIEYNVKCDPEAARVVFNSGIPITMLGLDVTKRKSTRINREHLRQIKNVGTPLTDIAAVLIENWWKTKKLDGSCMHDVLAVAFSFDRSLVKTKRMRVNVETKGMCTTAFTLVTVDENKANANVGLSVDGRKFLNLFMERVCSL